MFLKNYIPIGDKCGCIGTGGGAILCDKHTQEVNVEGQTIIDPKHEDAGKKHDGGKARMDLLSGTALIKIAEVMTFGAGKYGDHNWRSGISWSRVIAALLRHVFAFVCGEDKDPETGLSHLSHAGCCVMFLLEYEETRRDLDDRYKPSKKP